MIDFSSFRRPQPEPAGAEEPADALNSPWLLVPGATRRFGVAQQDGVAGFFRLFKRTTGRDPDVRDVHQVRYALEHAMARAIRIIPAPNRSDYQPYRDYDPTG